MNVLYRLCHKLGLSLCPSVSLVLSLSLSVSLSLSLHAVAREAGRMRSPAAAEGHGGVEIVNVSKRKRSSRSYFTQTGSRDLYVSDARQKVENYVA